MKRLVLFVAAALGACADTPIARDTRSIDWLTGCWRAEREGGYYEEVWLAPTADGSLGVSREVRGGRAVSHEFLRLEIRDDGTIAYVAAPSSQQRTEFLMTGHSPGRLVFENPQHDFPQRIEYRLVDPNAITATIQGPGKAGQARTFEYPLQRVECKD